MNRREFEQSLSKSMVTDTNIAISTGIEKVMAYNAKYDEIKKNKKGYTTTVIAIEELSELQKELTKCLRLKGDSTGLIEELADVQIMVEQIMIINNIPQSTINAAKKIKLESALAHMYDGDKMLI
jgi:NTP pyrophosphatase (non-canonical NTP hydrolase)